MTKHIQRFCRLIFILFLSYLFYPKASYAQTLTTSNLPIVLIDTRSQTLSDEPGIICGLKIINNAIGINNVTDSPKGYNGKAKIEYRGCSSQNFPKKPLGIELRSSVDSTASIDSALFGFPKESDWVLNPSYTDKTFTRDVLSFYMATSSGRYASRNKYVEVVIDGQYQGIFILEEKVKRNANRINVNKMDPTDVGANSITGGYVVKIDKSCGNYDPTHRWASAYSSPGGSQPHYWLTDYPTDANIVSQQLTYIKNYINAFETMMSSSTFCAGYPGYIADSTFVDYLLVEEMSSNADAYRFSTYLSKERTSKGGKMSVGPVWDFNLAFGFLTSPFSDNSQSYQGWRYTAPGDPSFPVPFWWGKLLTCPDFGAKTVSRYQQLRQTVWSTPVLMAFIDAQYAILNQGAFDRNFEKWPIIGVSTWNDQPSYTGTTLTDEFTYLKTWLTNRLNWMDTAICSFSTLPTVSISSTSPPINQGQTAKVKLTFTGSGPWSYTLSSGLSGTASSNTATVSVSPDQTTTYTIQAMKNGCGTGTGTGTATITVLPNLADLSLSMVTNHRVVAPGDIVSLELTLSNAGPKTAHAIQMENRLPAGATFVGSSLSTVTANNTIITLTTDSLEAGRATIFAYAIKMTTSGTLLNMAQITASNQVDPDSQPNSGTGDGQDDMATVDLRTPDATGSPSQSPNPNQTPLPTLQPNQPPTDSAKADLSLVLVADNLVTSANQVINLTLWATNRGGATATNVTLQTLLPEGWQLTDTSDLTINGQTVIGTIGSVGAGSSGSMVLLVLVSGSGSVSSQVLSVTPADPDSTPGNGYTNGEDDEATISIRVK